MNDAEYLNLYKQMVETRLLEEKSEELYQKGKIGGFMHLYIGQEATGVGAVSARRPDDNVITAYRDHGIAIACGMEPKVIFAEMFGKVTGSDKGKGGSMHLADVHKRFWGGHAIVGAHIALATGLAFADKYRKSDAVTLCFFGDGATNIGYFHESLNLASVWKLPCVFICENNKYGMWTPIEKVSGVADMRRKADAYGIPNEAADGMDLLAVRAAAEKAIAHARAGRGPYFLEVLTYRYRGHSMGDQRAYRTPDEMHKWQAEDPIGQFEHVLLKQGIAAATIDAIDDEVRQTIAEAIRFADESPFPADEEIWTDIYAGASR
ncbi:MAG: pyruvate dehydrogenase (acetyl-transferring) E1 component subunit alpha [Chloroflexi bacterium]|nr:pyruvate dehydrogenase (acetyl-transferring) E1 component subunit alpha [Chloroflexota bacterium]